MAQQTLHGMGAGITGGCTSAPRSSDEGLPGVSKPTITILRSAPNSSNSESVRLSTSEGNVLHFSSLAAAAGHLLASDNLDLRLI